MSKRKTVDIHNDRMLVERFISRVSGFNRRTLGFGDLCEACDRYGIKIIHRPMRELHGTAMLSSVRPYILINSLLTLSEKIIAGFHEYAHITDQHVPPQTVRLSTGGLYNLGKAERQAQVIGVIALMPDTEAAGQAPEELMKNYGVRRDVAEFRAGLRI